MPVPWPNRLFNLCLEYYYTIEFAVLRNPHPNLTLCYENRRPQTAFGEKRRRIFMLAGWAAGPCFTPIEKWERAQKVSLFILSANGSHFSTVSGQGEGISEHFTPLILALRSGNMDDRLESPSYEASPVTGGTAAPAFNRPRFRMEPRPVLSCVIICSGGAADWLWAGGAMA